MVGWRGSIQEVKVQMLNSSLGELLLIILWLVESDNERHSHLFEDRHIVLRCKRAVLVSNI